MFVRSITSVATLRFPFLPAFNFSSLNWSHNEREFQHAERSILKFVNIIEKFEIVR
jgi:hypothetical protein